MTPTLLLNPLTTAALAHMVELLPAPVVLVDSVGVVLQASPAASALLQLDDTAEGRALSSLLGTLPRPPAIAGRTPITTEEEEHVSLVALTGPPPPKDVTALAGAVAHDFNNLLGVIMNFTTLAAATVPAGSAAAGDLREVLAATQRAATIAGRLQELGDVRAPGRFTEPA